MKKILYILLLLFSVMLVCSCDTDSDSVPKEDRLSMSEILEKHRSKVVKIYTYDLNGLDKQGTGFFYNDSAHVITNAHVMEDAYSAKGKKGGSTSLEKIEKVIEYNYSTSDYCTLITDFLNFSSPIFNENYKSGDICYSIGYPNDSSIVVIKEGVIVGDTMVDGVKYIENTAMIDHGSSGGMLVNAAGDIIGMTTCLLENGNYGAIPYSGFKNATGYSASKILNAKSVLETFHTVKTVSLNTTNIFTYFDISYLKNSSTYYSSSYTIYVSPKDYYKDKIIIKGFNIYISVKVQTFFTSSIGVKVSDSDYLDFHLYDTSTYPKSMMSYTSYIGSKSNLGTEISLFSVSGTIYVIIK